MKYRKKPEVHRLRTELEDVHAARIKAETEVTRLTLELAQARDQLARVLPIAEGAVAEVAVLLGVMEAAESLVRWHENCGIDLRTGGALVLLRQRLHVARGGR